MLLVAQGNILHEYCIIAKVYVLSSLKFEVICEDDQLLESHSQSHNPCLVSFLMDLSV